MRSQKSLRNKIGWHWIDSPYRCTSWMQEWQFHTFFLLQDRCNFLLLMVPLCSGRKFQKSIAVSIWRSVSFGPRCVKSWLTPVVTFGNYVHRPRPMESRLFFFLYQLFVCLYCDVFMSSICWERFFRIQKPKITRFFVVVLNPFGLGTNIFWDHLVSTTSSLRMCFNILLPLQCSNNIYKILQR